MLLQLLHSAHLQDWRLIDSVKAYCLHLPELWHKPYLGPLEPQCAATKLYSLYFSEAPNPQLGPRSPAPECGGQSSEVALGSKPIE